MKDMDIKEIKMSDFQVRFQAKISRMEAMIFPYVISVSTRKKIEADGKVWEDLHDKIMGWRIRSLQGEEK